MGKVDGLENQKIVFEKDTILNWILNYYIKIHAEMAEKSQVKRQTYIH